MPRPLEPRLAGDFAHVPCRPAPASFACDGTGRLAADRLLEWARSVPDGEVLRGDVLQGEVLQGEVLQGEVLDGEVLRGGGAPIRGERERRGALLSLLGSPDDAGLERAAALLERTVARHPESAPIWSDYGAVLWARFQAAGSGLDAFQALEAVERALALYPERAEAHFNRALIAQRLGLRQAALDAWSRAAELETDPDWLDEITRRRDELERSETAQGAWESRYGTGPSETRGGVDEAYPWRSLQWLLETGLPARAEERSKSRAEDPVEDLADALARLGDPLLRDVLDAWPEDGASGEALRTSLVELGRGLRALEALETADGAAAVRSALQVLRPAEHPLRWNAELADVIALSYTDSPAALRRTSDLLDQVPDYPSVRGRLHWLRGILLARRSQWTEAVASYEEARRTLRPVYGEHPAAFLEVVVGEAASYEGRTADAFDVFADAVARVTRHGDRRRLHSSLMATGAALQTAGLHHAARRVYAEAVDNARRWGEDYAVAAALRRRVLAERAVGSADDADGVEPWLREARAATAGIADPVIRELTLGDLAVEDVRGRLDTGRVSPEDRNPLHSALATFESVRSGFNVSQTRLVASRLEAALENWPGALEAIETARDGFEARPAEPLRRPGARGSGLGRELDLQHARALVRAGRAHEVSKAVEAFERSRRAAVGGPQRDVPDGRAVPVEGIASAAEAWARETGAALLLFQEGDPALRFRVDAEGVFADELRVSSGEVRDLAAGLAALETSEQDRRLAELGRRLLPSGWTPPGRLVLVADPDFDGVPFSALRHPDTDRVLVEQTAVAHAPHLASLLRARDGEPAGDAAPRVLVVASPEAVAPALPAAEREAESVAYVWESAGASTHRRRHPSVEALASDLQAATVFHFAGHSRSRPLDPYRRELLLAPGEALGMDRILRLDLRRLDLVFLSSCDSASMVPLELPGPGFADALLAAGARQVVGTLWPVEDGTAEVLVETFYARLGAGDAAIDALRAARLRLRNESGARDWMAYRLVGSVLPPAADPRPDRAGARSRTQRSR